MMADFDILPMSIDCISTEEYGNEHFIEIHLDEQFNMGENIQLCKVWKKKDSNEMTIVKSYKTFHNPDQCIDFITSYEWRKVFLALTDKFSYLLELIHNLPQIVFFYIYSESPDIVIYKKEQYSKLRTIVQKNSSDANNQLLEDIEIFRRDLMPNVVKPIKPKTKLLIQEALTLDEYLVIWLQDDENYTTIDTSPISDIIKSLKIFFNFDQCIDFIKSSNDKRIFFISSHSNNTMIVDKISNYSQIIAIYILQIQKELTINSKLSDPKFHGIFSNIKNLSKELSKEYERCLKHSPIPISVFLRDKNVKTVRDLNKDNVRFLWFQLLVDILIKIPYNDQAKDEMLFECRKHYGIPCKDDENIENSTMKNYDKKAEKDMLDFEKNYKSTEALKFYSNDSFLYRLFNQALRTENIDLLFIFRFLLADMYKHLQKLYSEQYPDKLPQTVYRGQCMTNVEFNSIKDNVGRLISISTFFSTSVDFDVAERFSGYGGNPDPNILSVLFEIEVDIIHSTIKRPFASINALSTFSDEAEVVFSVGSIFRIEYVQDKRTIKEKGYWYVKLKLIEDDNDISELRNELENEYCKESNICSLGQALTTMGDYERAERFYHMLLEYIHEDNQNTYRIYSCLGKLAHHKGDYQTSLNYLEKALEYLNKLTFYNVQENISQVYVDIGVSYHGLGKLDLAMKYFTMATDIQTSPKLLSYTYNQIGLLYRDKDNKHLALEYFQKVLHIDEQILKTNQYKPELATAYNNIGEIYSKLGDYENASKYLHHALDIRLKGTISTHTDLAAIYNNLGTVYFEQKEWKKTLEVLEKALEIDTKIFGNNHKSLAITHNNIGVVYGDMNDLNRALYHSETALRILSRSQAGENDVNVCKFQYNIGMIQFQLGNIDKAWKITQKSLRNQLRILSENHESFAHMHFLLSKICNKEKDKTTALKYMEKALEIARISILPYDKSKFQSFQIYYDMLKNDQCYDDIGLRQVYKNLYCVSDNPDEQDYLMSIHHKELTQISPDDIIERLQLLNSIAIIYGKKENYHMAIKYFDEAVELFIQNKKSDRSFSQDLEYIIISIYYSMSRIYYKQEDWTMSINSLETALDFALKQKQQHPMLAEIYHSIGLSYKHKLDIFMAIHYLELAISTATKELPNDHSRVQVYLHNLRQLKPSI
ncbi:unnamed protein product [Rotaria sordida]|uniref:Uncharacterized protein n=1 Tax=Rotaria sordida TaxID=392033 RepID=A0A819JDN5_9BILA|nr:unnamed protein product [Rotaria sordida]